MISVKKMTDLCHLFAFASERYTVTAGNDDHRNHVHCYHFVYHSHFLKISLRSSTIWQRKCNFLDRWYLAKTTPTFVPPGHSARTHRGADSVTYRIFSELLGQNTYWTSTNIPNIRCFTFTVISSIFWRPFFAISNFSDLKFYCL